MKKLIIIMAILLLCALFIGCAKPAPAPATTPAPTSAPKPTPTPTPTAPTPKYGGVFKHVEGIGPAGSFGWPAETVAPQSGITAQVGLESLIRMNTKGELFPRLATDWKVDTAKNSITFNLRKGVKFHDGTDFNAKAAKWIMDKMIEGKVGSALKWKSIDALDDYTIQVNLTAWENTQLTNFTGEWFVSPTAFEKNGLEWMRTNIVGTGPFKFVSFQRDVVTKFAKFSDYWDKGKPYLDGIEITYIADEMTAAAALQTGTVDSMVFEVSKIGADLKAKGLPFVQGPSGTVILVPDSDNADSPYANIKVRQAVEYAIDRESLVKAKGYGFYYALYQVAPDNSMAFVPGFQGRRYDPAKAKQLLTEAGYPQGFSSKIIAAPTGLDRDMVVAIQSYLGEVGIKMSLEFPEYAKWVTYRQGKWNNGLLCTPTASYPNYNSFFYSYFAKTAPTYLSLKRPESFLQALDASLQSPAPDASLMQKITMKVYDEAMVIPLYPAGRYYCFQPYVHDTGFMQWGVHSNWRPDLTWLSK